MRYKKLTNSLHVFFNLETDMDEGATKVVCSRPRTSPGCSTFGLPIAASRRRPNNYGNTINTKKDAISLRNIIKVERAQLPNNGEVPNESNLVEHEESRRTTSGIVNSLDNVTLDISNELPKDFPGSGHVDNHNTTESGSIEGSVKSSKLKKRVTFQTEDNRIHVYEVPDPEPEPDHVDAILHHPFRDSDTTNYQPYQPDIDQFCHRMKEFGISIPEDGTRPGASSPCESEQSSLCSDMLITDNPMIASLNVSDIYVASPSPTSSFPSSSSPTMSSRASSPALSDRKSPIVTRKPSAKGRRLRNVSKNSKATPSDGVILVPSSNLLVVGVEKHKLNRPLSATSSPRIRSARSKRNKKEKTNKDSKIITIPHKDDKVQTPKNNKQSLESNKHQRSQSSASKTSTSSRSPDKGSQVKIHQGKVYLANSVSLTHIPSLMKRQSASPKTLKHRAKPNTPSKRKEEKPHRRGIIQLSDSLRNSVSSETDDSYLRFPLMASPEIASHMVRLDVSNLSLQRKRLYAWHMANGMVSDSHTPDIAPLFETVGRSLHSAR